MKRIGPVLAPLAPLVPGVGERPVVAIAHGLKRALLVADRLVWRLGAQPCEPVEPAPADSLSVTVCSDEGEIFWVAQPRVLLRDVALPALPPPEIASGPRPARPLPGRAAPAEPEWMVLRAEDVEPLTLEAADVEPIGLIATAAPAAPDAAIAPHATVVPAATIAAATHPSRLLPEWLERFGTAGASARAISGVEPEAPMPAPASTPAAGPAVLIAEDSFAARHFLTRMFEQRGLAVRGVDSAAALRQALAESPWSLVCVDIELPDGRGREWLEEMRAALEARDVPLVVLVRDDEDTEIAAASGVGRWLRKPFDRDEIDHLLSRLGLGAERLT